MPKRPRSEDGGGGDDLVDAFAVELLQEAPDAAAATAEGAPGVPEPFAALSKRQRRKQRAAAALAAAGGPALALDAPVKRLPPGASEFFAERAPADAAAALWAAFTASPQGASLTVLEYGAPLGATHVVSRTCVGGLPGLPAAVKAVLPKWGALLGTRGAAAPRSRGAPALLLLTHSAPRACDLIKALVPLGTRVAKLFARHVSEEDAAAALQGGPPVALAVGTPGRVAALLKRGALSLESAVVVAIDAAPDKRGLCLLTEKESRELWWGVYLAHVHPRLLAGQCKLALLF
jgi:hypothetical protein